MSTQKQTILIVDDDDELRETLSIALDLDGYEVYTATNGKDAIEQLRKMRKPCAILLDLLMPVMNGWEFLKASSREPILEGVPLFVVSCSHSQQALPQAVQYVKKPFDLNTLLRMVHTT